MYIEHKGFEFDDLSVSQQATLNLAQRHLENVNLVRTSSREDLECWVSAIATCGQNDCVIFLQFQVNFENGPVRYLGPPIPVDRSSFLETGWAPFPVFELIRSLFEAKYHYEPIFEEATTG